MTSAQREHEVRQRLLDAAAELIPERGWAAVSTRAVAERAGLAPGLVHYHFTSVHALLSQAAVAVMHRAAAETGPLLAGVGDPSDLAQALVASLDAYTGTDPVSGAGAPAGARSDALGGRGPAGHPPDAGHERTTGGGRRMMRAVICGAGIAGLALANRLSTAGWDVVVLERAPGPRPQGYMIDFFGLGYEAAEAMGIAPRLHELGYHVHEAALVGADGRIRGRLGYDRFADVVGGRLLSIMRPDLELALRESLPPAVRIRYGSSPVRVDDTGTDGVAVTLADGETLTADLLVGADGIHSAVREMVFGPEPDYLRHLGFHTAAFSFADPALHARVRGRFHLTDTIDRQMGLYGLRDDRVAVFAVHRTDDPALPEDPTAALRAEYGSLGWVVPDALAHCPPADEVYYDQVAQVVMPSWHRGRVALLGDACYAVSLLAGQGASLGIAGAFVLADQLQRAPTVGSALADYERLWRPVAEEKQQVARHTVRWFLPNGPVDLWVRRGMLALSRVPGLDRMIGGALAGRTSTIITELRRQQEGPAGSAGRPSTGDAATQTSWRLRSTTPVARRRR